MMAEKVYIENVSSISNADENWMFTSGRKRKLTSIDRSIEMVSPENVTKRLKLEENTEISDVEMDKNEKKVLGNKSEMIDTINTRTYSRKKLTAENLKTILRYLLANNSVLTMVQNSLKSQKENKSQLETKDQPISKVPAAKEINKLSDEDAMSSVKVDDLNASKMDEHILPDSKPPDQLSDDEDALVIALPETDVSHDKEVDKIAQRTRSKLCLNDTPLETIESSFQPPDITIDMYDTHCDDAVWKEFLCEFTKPLTQGSGVGSVADDTEDERDPEYNVQEEEEDEDEEIDYDEICGENPLEVTGDEVKALMTEILEFAQEDKSLLEQDFSFLEELSVAFSGNEKNSNDIQKEGSQDVSEKEKNENVSKLENCCNNLETVIDSKDSNEKDNFNKSGEQEYVQMLTQSYLLSHGFSSLHFINASSRFFLYEIKILASRGTPNNQRSAFYAHNLDDAIDIVSKFENLAEPEKAKKRKMNKGIPEYVKKALASSKAFIYPELLPTFGFYTFYRGSKASFSAAEDNLIALGLEQFSYMEDPLECIQKFLLPTKSRYQIKCRIKNSKQKRDTENPIAYYCKYKKLPEFNRVIRIFDPNNVKAPEEYPPSALPAWMEPYSGESLQKRIMEKQRIQDKRPKLILPRMQLAPTIIHEYHPPDPQGILQPMICKVYSVNENNVSNGNSGIILPKRITRKRKRLAKYQVNKSTQYPELPEVSSNSCVSQTIKQEPLSEGTSDEESIENENNSDSSSECSFNLKNPITKKIYSLRKRTVATKSMSTNHETCQTEISLSATTQTFNPVSVKEEPSSSESSNEVHNENNSSHKKHDQLHVEHSALTEPSLRIVTSHGDESSDSDEDNVICNELLEPIQKFYCGINEDAVLPPASNSVQKRLPSDFSTIRDIICSEEKRKKDLNTCKNKVRSKKPGKSKKNWSTEEDQLIISNCQKYGINKRAFRVSADEIGSITPIKVKQRFICLLKLLSEKLKNGSENH
ncbi:GON-4-like protein like [Argiope bruennichi]|uniref:GON-4-like protein like n=1 Tax=Argiope bruennichi TaxID=94029 RepID=A0A8T0FSC3_ARGBR|nr:GON-4-like protein like [Argiope bruennichi]